MATHSLAYELSPLDIISKLDNERHGDSCGDSGTVWLAFALAGIVVGDDMCCYMGSSCGEIVRAVSCMQKQITDGTGATRHMARWDVGTWGDWWCGPEPGLGPCGIPDEVPDTTLSRLVEM